MDADSRCAIHHSGLQVAVSGITAEVQAETKGQPPIPFGIGALVRVDVLFQGGPGISGEGEQDGSRFFRGAAGDEPSPGSTRLADARRPFPGGEGE